MRGSPEERLTENKRKSEKKRIPRLFSVNQFTDSGLSHRESTINLDVDTRLDDFAL